MITLNFVYYYLCIIKFNCTLFGKKHQFHLVIYIFCFARLFLQPSHILKTNQYKQNNFLQKKKLQEKKEEILNKFPKLTKTGIFSLSKFRVLEHKDLNTTNQRVSLRFCPPSNLWQTNTIHLPKALHMALSTYTSFSMFNNNTSHQDNKERTTKA